MPKNQSQIKRLKIKALTTLLVLLPLLLVIIACERPEDPILEQDLGNFSFVQFDTTYVGSEDFVVLHGEIISLLESDQSITVTRVERYKPVAWVNMFCVGPACLPDFISTFTFSLEAGDTAAFSLDTFHNGASGEGLWTIFAVDSTTMEVDSVNISMLVNVDSL